MRERERWQIELSNVLYALDTPKKRSVFRCLRQGASVASIVASTRVRDTTVHTYLHNFFSRELARKTTVPEYLAGKLTRAGQPIITWSHSDIGSRVMRLIRHYDRWLDLYSEEPATLLGKNGSANTVGGPVNRMIVLSYLSEQPCSLPELLDRLAADGIHIHKTLVAQHLRKMRRSGLVVYNAAPKKQGPWAQYTWIQGKDPTTVTGSYRERELAFYTAAATDPVTREEAWHALDRRASIDDAGASMYALLQQGLVAAPLHYGKQTHIALKEKGRNFQRQFIQPMFAAFQP